MQVLGICCMVLPAGKLSDIYGRKRIFAIGTLISGIACIIGGTAQYTAALIVGRFLQGVGGAFIFASALALVSSIPPPEQRTRVIGIYVSVAYLGIVIGPLFGGFVLEYFHWRWVFYLPAAALLSISALGLFGLPWERYGDRNSRLRFLDITLYMLSLGLIAISVFETQHLEGQILLLSGVLAFSGFCWFQTKRKDPLLQVSLFVNNPIYALLGLTHFLVYSAILALPFTLTLYLQYVHSISAQTTGWVLTSQAVLTALIAPASGWLAGRFRVRTLLICSAVIMVIGVGCFTQLSTQSSVLTVIAGLALIGLSVGISDTQIINTALGSVEDKYLGSASATLNGLRTMGGFVGIGIVSYLMANYLGPQQITQALYPQLMKMLQAYFYVATVLVIFALILLLIGLWKRASV